MNQSSRDHGANQAARQGRIRRTHSTTSLNRAASTRLSTTAKPLQAPEDEKSVVLGEEQQTDGLKRRPRDGTRTSPRSKSPMRTKSGSQLISKTPSQQNLRTPSQRMNKSPSQRIGKSPSQRMDKSPPQRIDKSPSQRIDKSPSQQNIKSPTPQEPSENDPVETPGKERISTTQQSSAPTMVTKKANKGAYGKLLNMFGLRSPTAATEEEQDRETENNLEETTNNDEDPTDNALDVSAASTAVVDESAASNASPDRKKPGSTEAELRERIARRKTRTRRVGKDVGMDESCQNGGIEKSSRRARRSGKDNNLDESRRNGGMGRSSRSDGNLHRLSQVGKNGTDKSSYRRTRRSGDGGMDESSKANATMVKSCKSDGNLQKLSQGRTRRPTRASTTVRKSPPRRTKSQQVDGLAKNSSKSKRNSPRRAKSAEENGVLEEAKSDALLRRNEDRDSEEDKEEDPVDPSSDELNLDSDDDLSIEEDKGNVPALTDELDSESSEEADPMQKYQSMLIGTRNHSESNICKLVQSKMKESRREGPRRTQSHSELNTMANAVMKPSTKKPLPRRVRSHEEDGALQGSAAQICMKAFAPSRRMVRNVDFPGLDRLEEKLDEDDASTITPTQAGDLNGVDYTCLDKASVSLLMTLAKAKTAVNDNKQKPSKSDSAGKNKAKLSNFLGNQAKPSVQDREEMSVLLNG